MRLLLDTHTFLWFVMGNALLNTQGRRLIEDADNTKYLSMASLWEMAIKVSTGKMQLGLPLPIFISNHLPGIRILPIELPHTVKVSSLPFHHRDPFDRMIIAQSLVEQVPIVSIDGVFDDYGVQRLWQPQ